MGWGGPGLWSSRGVMREWRGGVRLRSGLGGCEVGLVWFWIGWGGVGWDWDWDTPRALCGHLQSFGKLHLELKHVASKTTPTPTPAVVAGELAAHRRPIYRGVLQLGCDGGV